MKNFEAFRYIRKWKYLIIAVCILGAFLVYQYAMSKQLYVAETVLRYSNVEAKSGMTPSGDTLDVTEVYSSDVITGVLEDLNLSTGADSIRSKCAVEPIIPADEEQRKEAILKEGEEYIYNPTDYHITFSVGSEHSKEYAANVLDSVLKNYFIAYGDRYINQTVLPNNASNIKDGDYDYIESAEILDSSANDIYKYLYDKKYHYPYFRSAATGYTFNDLYNMYNQVLSYDVPELCSKILNQKISKDQDVLIKDYRNRINQDEINLKNLQEKVDPLYDLITQYSAKSKEGIQYHYGQGTDTDRTNDYILKDVYEDHDRIIATETTYDTLINQYVKLEISRQYSRVDMEHKQDLLRTFTSATPASDAKEAVDEIERDMDELIEKLDGYYSIVEATVEEFNQYLGASNITNLTSVTVNEKVNVKLYMLIAIILFLICGCLGAVFLGRTQDFVEYLMYIDRKTSLPNRAKCDMVIDKYEEVPLKDNFAFILIRLDTLKAINSRAGREAGDSLLGEFGHMLSEAAGDYGFAGYNGSDQFFCMFEDCSRKKAEMFVINLSSVVEHYNSRKPKYEITFSYAIEESKTTGIYDIRKLMSASFKDINAGNTNANAAKNDNGGDKPEPPTPTSPAPSPPTPPAPPTPPSGGGLKPPSSERSAQGSQPANNALAVGNDGKKLVDALTKAVLANISRSTADEGNKNLSALNSGEAAKRYGSVDWNSSEDDNKPKTEYKAVTVKRTKVEPRPKTEPKPEVREVPIEVKEILSSDAAHDEKGESAEQNANPYAPKQREKKSYRTKDNESGTDFESYAPKKNKNRS